MCAARVLGGAQGSAPSYPLSLRTNSRKALAHFPRAHSHARTIYFRADQSQS